MNSHLHKLCEKFSLQLRVTNQTAEGDIQLVFKTRDRTACSIDGSRSRNKLNFFHNLRHLVVHCNQTQVGNGTGAQVFSKPLI